MNGYLHSLSSCLFRGKQKREMKRLSSGRSLRWSASQRDSQNQRWINHMQPRHYDCNTTRNIDLVSWVLWSLLSPRHDTVRNAVIMLSYPSHHPMAGHVLWYITCTCMYMTIWWKYNVMLSTVAVVISVIVSTGWLQEVLSTITAKLLPPGRGRWWRGI